MQYTKLLYMAFLYTNGKLNDKEIRETIIYNRQKKYLMKNLIKLVKDLYGENFKTEK